VAALFPALCAEAVDILSRWHKRFPKKIWSRMCKVYEGSAHHTPCVLKELNESAPVICRVRDWAESLPRNAPPAYIMDLGAGFGFLSMFLSELLPRDRVSRCILMDASFPNRGVEASAGSIGTEHIYGCGEWRIPLYTLKVDLKKGRALNQIAERVLRAPVSEDASLTAPAIVCGVHLCNTLGLRAAQLFNEHPEVVGMCLVPCCFPTQRHLQQKVVYQLGSHRFEAEAVLNRAVLPTSTLRFASWTENILEGIEPGDAGSKALERHALHKPSKKTMFAQDVYIFANRPWQEAQDVAARDARGLTGGAVIVDAEYGHANARIRGKKKKKKGNEEDMNDEHCEDFQVDDNVDSD